MQKLPKILAVFAVLAAIVVIGLALGWFATKSTTPPPPKLEDTTIHWEPDKSNHAPTTALNTSPSVVHPVRPRPTPPPPTVTPVSTDPSTTTGLITNWEDRIDEILADDTDDTNKVKVLFAMFPHLPEDGQTEVAQHLSNLVEDENYAPLGQMLKDTKLPESVLDVLLSDLLNRPNSTKLPLLVDVASNPDHAKASEAKDLLELYLDQDYGADWDKWREKAKEWVKDNPD